MERNKRLTASSLSSYGRFATMTLVVLATPFSGGPRLRRALKPALSSSAVVPSFLAASVVAAGVAVAAGIAASVEAAPSGASAARVDSERR